MAQETSNEPQEDTDYDITASLSSSFPEPDTLLFPLDGLPDVDLAKRNKSEPHGRLQLSVSTASGKSGVGGSADDVIVTNLDYIPGAKINRFLGRVSHHLIREEKDSKAQAEGAGTSGSYNRLGNLASVFLREAISVARAHTTAIGGEALIGFSIDSFSLVAVQGHTGYCLISFSGDAVSLRRPKVPK